MRTVAVVSQKGGSGKTTVALAVAIGLWRRGRRVLLADIDPQRSSVEVLKARRIAGPEVVASSASKLFALQTQSRRDGVGVLVVDTPGAIEEETIQAVGLCDLAVMVLRPTYLDLAAAVNTSRMIRQLNKPGVILLNQAPVARAGVEPPAIDRTLKALKLLRMPIASVILRSRAIHQTALEQGCSSEEVDGASPGGLEGGLLSEIVQHLLFEAPAQAPAQRWPQLASEALSPQSVHRGV